MFSVSCVLFYVVYIKMTAFSKWWHKPVFYFLRISLFKCADSRPVKAFFGPALEIKKS